MGHPVMSLKSVSWLSIAGHERVRWRTLGGVILRIQPAVFSPAINRSFLLIPGQSSGRSLGSKFLCFSFMLGLDGMRADDRPNQPWEASLDLRATRGVVHLHAAPFAPDQPRLSQRPEVLRERGLRNCLVTNGQKHRAVMRVLLSHNIREDLRPHRVGQGMENPFYRDVFKRRMK